MTKLSDIQAILFSTASQRKEGHFLPLPAAAKGKEPGAKKALAALLKKDLAAETHTKDRAQVWREDGEWLIGLVITQAGLEAIGATDPEADGKSEPAPEEPGDTPSTTPPRAGSKAARVIELLKRKGGATLSDIVEATGWLPHTARAALTGLRKKGHDITRESKDGTSLYRITKNPA